MSLHPLFAFALSGFAPQPAPPAPRPMWRPRVKCEPYDLIKCAERSRLRRKWDLYQARRAGWRSEDIAQIERDVEYYDTVLPKWRAEREAQQVRP